jgi:hypothetical protein
MSLKNMTAKQFKNRTRKSFALYLAFTILFQTGFPTFAWALTGGPSQPEVQSFEPISTSDMVDPFSGDFKYNIPLMNVDGYPINISYHSGISMDQEASWVGLGWNINAGVINRSMRGIPDDFKGDQVEKEIYMKPNRTFGINVGADAEAFGIPIPLQLSVGVKYNNYTGYSIDRSLNLSISAGLGSAGKLNGGLGISSSSSEGLSLQPSVSYSVKAEKNDRDGSSSRSLSSSIGTSFNSRAGLQNLSISTSVSASSNQVKRIPNLKGNDELVDGKSSSLNKSASASFDFGMPTYTPSIQNSMYNLSATGNFKVGLELFGGHGSFKIGGFLSTQELASNKITNPAYGYMYAEDGQNNSDALMDFNREKDGGYSKNTPGLAIPNFTYDLFSVTGQGTGGSYRPYRSDIGHVFDAASSVLSGGITYGTELGAGNVMHFGVDLGISGSESSAGKWEDDNQAVNSLNFKSKSNNSNPLYEPVYFKEANERSVDTDPSFFERVGKYEPVSVKLNQLSTYEHIATNTFNEVADFPTSNVRAKRDIRNQSITTLTREQYANFALEPGLLSSLYTSAPAHHIAEISSINTDGSRYVYGIAAYNKFQHEITFAAAGRTINAVTGLVNGVNATDLGKDNKRGIDNYYSNTKTPAYAHSYLLTAVLSPDYVDADAIKGPSSGDLGSYTKFEYEKVEGYQWRVPLGSGTASANEGMRSITEDDKGNIIYGEKEQWFLKKVITKNYVAVFDLKNDRLDGYGVSDVYGAVDNTKKPLRLSKISLYSRPDYEANIANLANANPLKEVNFKHEYILCKNSPNAPSGKLTLTEIWFTYQKSFKGRLSPYKFTYSAHNPDYNLKGYDRWGNYKPIVSAASYTSTSPLSNSDFPYVEQNKAATDINAEAWTLKQIDLPSGGRINLEFESDDYAYVQHKKAMQMFKVVDIVPAANTTAANTGIIAKNFSPGSKLVIEMQAGSIATSAQEFYDKYISDMPFLYFRFLSAVKNNADMYEFVSGYVKKENITVANVGLIANTNFAYIQLPDVTLNDSPLNPGDAVNPIDKAAVQFARLNMPRQAWGPPPIADPDKAEFGKDLFEAFIASGFFSSISDAINGPNQALHSIKYNVGGKFIANKSWLRLMNPNGKKLGGGLRVKKVAILDNWSTMSNTLESSAEYGQTYSYNNEDGTSSGVASYEPQLGGDENPWRVPVFKNEKRLLAPDDESYLEEPFGESFFPSPSIGYGRVTVQSYGSKGGKTNTGTGKMVHEFYTAKDFPTIVKRTDIDPKRGVSKPYGLRKLLNLDVRDYVTVTQGYSIELNDMHGKPKAQKMYARNQVTPFNTIQYKYKSDPYLTNSLRLNNTQTVIDNNGNVSDKEIGVFFDFVADTREQKSLSFGVNGSLNFDVSIYGIIPLATVTGYASASFQRTRFRSIVTNKVIQRFGLLDETITNNEGSVTSIKNLAYDAESGEVLLTQVANNFNDPIYNLTVPAFWYYDGMGPAYKNIGLEMDLGLGFNYVNGEATVPNAPLYFSEGDELALSNGRKAWITAVNSNSIVAVYKNGDYANTGGVVKIIRSGRKNQQSLPMASLTTLSNPLTKVKSNVYESVLQSSAIEYDNTWRTTCNCFEQNGAVYSTNPYQLGTKGYWKTKRSFTYLAERTQNVDLVKEKIDKNILNTNVRKDGQFASYKPYYRYNGSAWEVDGRDWTYTSEVTEMSPQGMELENRDALGNYSSALYGYNQKLPLAVTSNAKYQEMAYDNFEDYQFSTCADNHFKFRTIGTGANPNNTTTIATTQGHTGRSSILVSASGGPVVLQKNVINTSINPPCVLQACDLSVNTSAASTTGVTVTKGFPPYKVKWNVLYGVAAINTSPSGAQSIVAVTGTSPYAVELIVTDKKGCKVVNVIKN